MVCCRENYLEVSTQVSATFASEAASLYSANRLQEFCLLSQPYSGIKLDESVEEYN